MTPEAVTNAVCEHVASRLTPAVDRYAESLLGQVRDLIDVAVTYSGRKAIRSKPGEPPRREFGNYQRSWQSRSSREGDRISASVGTTSNIGPFLEFGTGRMAARPHASRAAARARADAGPQIQQNL